jgi:transcription elongation factor GreA
MSEETYLTSEGAANLRTELEELKGPKRTDLAKRLRVAIQQGDLSENADYIIAKEEQGFLEGRILEIESILKNAKIIDDRDGLRDVVDLGARVTIQEEDYPPETYYLVGVNEANPRKGRISHASPIGLAVIGHRVGDEVFADTPGGKIKIKILQID